MPWYKKTFGKDYLNIYSHRDEEDAGRVLDLIESLYSPLAGKKGWCCLRVLDFCCGQGRHSRLLAQAGHEVVGLDLSADLLREAHRIFEENDAGKGHLWFVRADMRQAPFSEKFDLAINMFTSFGYFEEDEENRLALASMSQALKKGGRFLIDYLNRPHVIETLVEEDCFEHDTGLTVLQRRKISDQGRRVEKTVIVETPDRRDRYEESVRLYSREDMESMLSNVGLKVDRVLGDYDGSPLRPDSPRLILTGLKK